MSQKLSVSSFLNRIYSHCKSNFLVFTTVRWGAWAINMISRMPQISAWSPVAVQTHRHQNSPQKRHRTRHQQHGSRTPIWSLAAAQLADISMASGSSTGCPHQHVFQQQHDPWTSTVSSCSRTSLVAQTTNTNMASGGGIEHRHLSGPGW